jgi:outer membrane protein assembly factor BamB
VEEERFSTVENPRRKTVSSVTSSRQEKTRARSIKPPPKAVARTDLTPAIHRHGSTYSLIIKDNYYVDWPDSPRDFYITQLSPNFDIEWRFKATETDHCHRDANDDVVCEPGDTGTFEWCMNAPAVDKNGTIYAISEDGWLYAIDQGGTMRDRIFLELAVGAAYTPAAIGHDGRIYAQNYGHLFVAGK